MTMSRYEYKICIEHNFHKFIKWGWEYVNIIQRYQKEPEFLIRKDNNKVSIRDATEVQRKIIELSKEEAFTKLSIREISRRINQKNPQNTLHHILSIIKKVSDE